MGWIATNTDQWAANVFTVDPTWSGITLDSGSSGPTDLDISVEMFTDPLQRVIDRTDIFAYPARRNHYGMDRKNERY